MQVETHMTLARGEAPARNRWHWPERAQAEIHLAHRKAIEWRVEGVGVPGQVNFTEPGTLQNANSLIANNINSKTVPGEFRLEGKRSPQAQNRPGRRPQPKGKRPHGTIPMIQRVSKAGAKV